MARTVFPHKDLARLSYECVPLMAHQRTTHGEGEYIFGREKKHMCEIYDLPNCKAHEEMAGALNRKNMLPGVRGTPTHIVFDPRDMSEISRANMMNVSQIEDAIVEAQKKIGKPVRWRAYSKMRSTLDEAAKQVEEKEWRKAIRELKGFDAEGMKNLEEEATALMETILAAGREMISVAKAAAEAGDVKKAKDILRDVSRDFNHTDLEDEAKTLLRDLKD